MHILILEARFYDHISDKLAAGAIAALEAAGASYDRVTLPGALEIPPAIAMAAATGNYDGYVALGCVIRGETFHFDVVCNESARGIMDLGIQHKLAIGNGILTVENEKQALERADPKKMNKGAGAAEACLALIALKRQWMGL
ncbi:6,7-dimethyl-8-ribityllumazine synthase [bacterium]|nr:6,7-dimethyl-8-ribityllumazine synthase [bacterium]